MLIRTKLLLYALYMLRFFKNRNNIGYYLDVFVIKFPVSSSMEQQCVRSYFVQMLD